MIETIQNRLALARSKCLVVTKKILESTVDRRSDCNDGFGNDRTAYVSSASMMHRKSGTIFFANGALQSYCNRAIAKVLTALL